MSLLQPSIALFLVMTLLTGVVYPLLITLTAQLTMPYLANGSLLQKGEKTVGSLLIAQHTTGDRYFHPRPSAIDYDPLKPSGGSNWGPTSRKLKEAVEERKKTAGSHAPPELLYASGSGLDPHISLQAAYFQIPRVAKTRGVDEKSLKEWIDALAEDRQLQIFGSPYVNVLLLNHTLDQRDKNPKSQDE